MIIRMNISAGLLRSLYSGPGEEYGEDWVITTGFGWGVLKMDGCPAFNGPMADHNGLPDFVNDS